MSSRPGRPPIGTARTPRAALSPEGVAALARLCQRWGCSESEAIRRAIREADRLAVAETLLRRFTADADVARFLEGR